MRARDTRHRGPRQAEVIGLNGNHVPERVAVNDPPADELENAARTGPDAATTTAPAADISVSRLHQSLGPVPTLGWWNVYFLGKLALYWYAIIGLHPLANLAFALALLVPIPGRGLAYLRTVVAIPVAVALAYYDSWLPPFERLVAQASQVAAFSGPYLIEIAGRFINGSAVLLLAVVVVVYVILAKRVRVGAVVLTMLTVLVVADGGPQRPIALMAAVPPGAAGPAAETGAGSTVDAEADLDALLDQHFRSESTRQVRFQRPPADAVPFNLVFLHVCSLSWDDLQAMGLAQHPLFARFDILLTRFNAAATYSGPAVIRLLRAPCGQPSHASLYAQVPEQCYLVPELRQAGFDTNLVLNHDGHFDDLLGIIRRQGAQDIKPMPIAGLPIRQRSFDGSPIYDDLAVLNRWADSVPSGSATRVAAIYNTISLHDGNRLTGGPVSGSSLETYKLRLTNLLDDLERFVVRLEQSSRRTVVVLVPEHGAAVRGDKMQIAGMREIPTPAITLVPVGVKVIGPNAHRRGSPAQVDTPTTYTAIAQIVSRMLARSPFDRAKFRPQDYVSDLPTTRYVAENAGMVMMQRGDRLYLRMPKTGWSEYVATPTLHAGGRP